MFVSQFSWCFGGGSSRLWHTWELDGIGNSWYYQKIQKSSMHCCLELGQEWWCGSRRPPLVDDKACSSRGGVFGCIFVEIDMDKATLNKNGIHDSYRINMNQCDGLIKPTGRWTKRIFREALQSCMIRQLCIIDLTMGSTWLHGNFLLAQSFSIRKPLGMFLDSQWKAL